MTRLVQNPSPGEHNLYFRGDIVTFTLTLDAPLEGRAFLRTNIGNGAIRRKEIIAQVERNKAMSAQDWRDIPMARVNSTTYKISLALTEVAHFEGKCCFFLEGSNEPLWPEGDNSHINVEPSDYCSSNSIYCAFVRQFGPNKNKPTAENHPLTKYTEKDISTLDKAGYAVIPPSGTFRDLIEELDFIVDDLNCRILHLLPINPTPTVYGRMGRHGSPYAALDFTAVDPALAEFDTKATPLDQFLELVGAVHNKNAKIFLDIAINHTGWAAKIHETNPEWLVREDDGRIHSPGAWGVVWGDLTELNHECLELWSYLADMFLTWCERGVDGFRCDAGYMIPVPAWEYIIARVRDEYPDSIFLLEGLGGDPAITIELLDRANMNWAYSELFQNFSRGAVEGYIAYSDKISASDGIMVHYAETHDNLRLAGESHTYAKMRTSLCALTSHNGAFGFANGVEWHAKEKIDVHKSQGLNWGAKDNQVGLIGRLNTLLSAHPAFHNNSRITFINSGCGNAVTFVRLDEQRRMPLLVVANLDCSHQTDIKVQQGEVPFKCTELVDVINGKSINTKFNLSTNSFSLTLKPGEVFCLAPGKKDLQLITDVESGVASARDNISKQKAKAVVLSVLSWKHGTNVFPHTTDHVSQSDQLIKDPYAYLEETFKNRQAPPIIEWNWPEDMNRHVMVPPEHIMMVKSPYRFTAFLTEDGKTIEHGECLYSKECGYYFSFIIPKETPKTHCSRTLKMRLCREKELDIRSAEVLYLAEDIDEIPSMLTKYDLREMTRTFLDGNGRGGIMRPCLNWGELNSRYDAAMLANLSTEFPEDRHIMLRRFRGWVVYHGRWKELSQDLTKNVFPNKEGGVTWRFSVPVGNGLISDVLISLKMVDDKNAIVTNVVRARAEGREHYLKDELPIRVVLRPDVEDRSFHSDTKASQGPEHHWPISIEANEKSMMFNAADDRKLYMAANKGHFSSNQEWHYNLFWDKEASRGLEAHGDLFSPGFFDFELIGGEQGRMVSQVVTAMEPEKVDVSGDVDVDAITTADDMSFDQVLLRGMEKFIVKRDELKTVIAGYPWFLDWGRDTLICVRGLIAGGFIDDVKLILLQFAKYAENGTLPNIIHGDNVGNRDTSDAPLWFFTACEDLCKTEGDESFLQAHVDGKGTLLEVLEEIAQGYIDGTPNRIKVDHATHLVYSPSHFTWMDTNYPAGTPRQGFPIEIQALWFAALNFLGKATGKTDWQHLAQKVKKAINTHFVIKSKGYLADCLHCDEGVTTVQHAVRDDLLRCNQLFAVTLGAIDDKKLAKSILRHTSCLLIPGGIRTLADQPVKHESPVYGNGGQLLNDPVRPYWGYYEGDEDTRRKPAYHSGTAWSWPFPSWCEAHYQVYGEFGADVARSVLSSSSLVLTNGSYGQIPEIMDGNYPHKERGCDAQAWGVTELYRVWKMLH